MKKTNIRFFPQFLLACLLASLLLFSCDNQPEVEALPEQGELISVEKMLSLTPEQIDSMKMEVDPLLVLAIRPTYSVDVYRVIHYTRDGRGNVATASGVVLIPQGVEGALPFASYQHGTTISDKSVPSAGLGGGQDLVGISLCSDGFVVTMPDYLGLGYSDIDQHPYVHYETSAFSVTDIIRASRTHCTDLGVDLNGQVFIFGYSQGGYATMAAHKYIEENGLTNEFQITASAPMAGPYDLSGALVDLMLSFEPYDFQMYLPLTLIGMNSIYEVYPDASYFLKEPYATQIPPMLKGQHGAGEINALLPDVPREMLLDDLVVEFENDPNHPFRDVLKQNDVYDWLPIADIRLYHCTGDEQVPVAATEVTYNGFVTKGKTNIEWIDYGDYTHNECAAFAFLDVRDWFLSLKQ